MHIVVIADGENQKKFQDKEIPEGVLIQFVAELSAAKKDADGYFHLYNYNQVLKCCHSTMSLIIFKQLLQTISAVLAMFITRVFVL